MIAPIFLRRSIKTLLVCGRGETPVHPLHARLKAGAIGLHNAVFVIGGNEIENDPFAIDHTGKANTVHMDDRIGGLLGQRQPRQAE